ncbi:hypothetical protein [Methylocella silvestris]|uniref:hypothetical protein n=1 Tax=Methylocella silvestris TaxID=199596 RepID=UPI0011AFA6EF|nr:hypothetical protein [Methylocella silvestris]
MSDLEFANVVLRGLVAERIEETDHTNIRAYYKGRQINVSRSELNRYRSQKDTIKKQGETDLWMPEYYEHAVQFEGGLRRPFSRMADNISVQSDEGTLISVERASEFFCISLLDVDVLGGGLRRLLSRPFGSGETSVADLFRINTIKVIGVRDAFGRSAARMHELAGAAIFHFAYGKGVPISFTKSWERTNYWLGRKEHESIQFPVRTYNSELISYYNLALASDSLVLGYLALYKILEYFFTSVSEDVLHRKIKDHLASPDFAHTKTKKLRELVKLITAFETRLDEVGALKMVLSTYFEKSDLRNWIEQYQNKNGCYFTENANVFNKETRIDLSENTIINNISSRIYAVRNALVHNKEGEIARFIPYSGQEDVLHKEIQILIYLAEQLIIKTGKDIG